MRAGEPRGMMALAAAGLLAACATAPVPSPVPLPPPAASAPAPAPPALAVLSLSALPGWNEEDYAGAFVALLAACRASRDPAMVPACAAAAAEPPEDESRRAFLERWFVALPPDGPGLLTAYFTPLYPARHGPDVEFCVPVRPPPPLPELPPRDRAAIEAQPAPDALAWMRPEDLFLLQIQGSGVLTFADGTSARATFAGSNGLPYTAIGAILAARGALAPGRASAADIHDWLRDHRGPAAAAVMDEDQRYVYFRLQPEEGGPVVGSAGTPLPAGRSVAVDRTVYPAGALLWIDASGWRRLVAALDTGGAIRGAARADLYLGLGDAAGAVAARVRAPLRIWRLAPRP